MSIFTSLQTRQAVAALVRAGNTPEQAADIWTRAAKGDVAARAQTLDAMKTGADMPYRELERPRLLEEGLPFPPDYAFWVAIIYMMKKYPKMLERLAIKYMDSQARMIGFLAQAGSANMITGYAHAFLIGLMLEQNYMIRQRGADDLIASLNALVISAEARDWLAQLMGSSGFNVPEVISFAQTGTVAKGRVLPHVPKGGLPAQEKGAKT